MFEPMSDYVHFTKCCGQWISHKFLPIFTRIVDLCICIIYIELYNLSFRDFHLKK